MFFPEDNDIETRNSFTTYTKLMDAIVNSGSGMEPDIERIKWLLKKGANPNAGLGDSGIAVCSTPLDEGANCLILLMCRSKAFNNFSQNIQNIADLLINHGLDINAATKKGNTALHFAAHSELINWVRYLVDKKADPSVKNKMGIIPSDFLPDWDEIWEDDSVSQSLS
jgi:hypothetical protein